MKALSIRQPWAWLIIHGGKDVENREWKTNYRGRVLVHASNSMTKREYMDAWQKAYGINPALTIPTTTHIEKGGIVGSVEIVDCIRQSESPWFVGRFGFVLRDPKPIPFIPFRGSLGFFDVPDDLLTINLL